MTDLPAAHSLESHSDLQYLMFVWRPWAERQISRFNSFEEKATPMLAEVQTVVNSVQALDAKVTALKPVATNIQAAFTSLQSSVTSLTAQVAALSAGTPISAEDLDALKAAAATADSDTAALGTVTDEFGAILNPPA